MKAFRLLLENRRSADGRAADRGQMKRSPGLTTLGQSRLQAFLDEIARRETSSRCIARPRKSSSEISTVVFIWVPIPP
jgi:hypothetical protein